MTTEPAGSPRSLTPPAGGLTVRMYRQGLGDCFLLAFAGDAEDAASYVLIDCGVHGAQKDGRKVLAAAIENLVAATGGRLDAVVATHEHTDHLSGFVQGAADFLGDEFEIGELWLAWTENDGDPLAQRLREGRSAAARAVTEALEKLKRKSAGARSGLAVTKIAGFTGFFETDDRDRGARRAAAERLGVRDPDKVTGNELALALLRERAGRVRYFRPGGAPVAIPGVRSSRAYVLGPPRDEKLIKKSDPSRGPRSEVYFASRPGVLSFVAALQPGNSGEGPADQVLEELSFPFDRQHRLQLGQGLRRKFFRDRYGDAEQDWRRIDDDWLYSAETLALHLDSDTNNTSLALAFEFGAPGSGRVLLFPGDAQVGNWLSWKDVSWRVGGKKVKAEDLLRRTALYKVSHHASHNGTVKRDAEEKPFGLELMPDDLLAMIPVDREAAGKLRGWDMPYGKLYDVLKEKSSGNVLRSDDLDPDLAPVPLEESTVPGLPDVSWRRSRENKPDGHSLYYDVTFTAE